MPQTPLDLTEFAEGIQTGLKAFGPNKIDAVGAAAKAWVDAVSPNGSGNGAGGLSSNQQTLARNNIDGWIYNIKNNISLSSWTIEPD